MIGGDRFEKEEEGDKKNNTVQNVLEYTSDIRIYCTHTTNGI